MPMGWGDRIAEAVLHYSAAVHRRVSLEEFGALLAHREGREKSYGKATVSAWIKEKNEPGLKTFDAMAALVRCDPWWIVWGVGQPPANVLLPETTKAVPRGESARKSGP